MNHTHIQWQDVPEKMPELWYEMTDHFQQVHTEHVERVQKNLALMGGYYEELSPAMGLQIAQRAILHDQSKLQEPEYVPYVWRINRTLWKKTNSPHLRWLESQTLDQAIQDAVRHHVTHNRHHPEWHMDADDMSVIDIIEMVCDWYAMSQEFNTSIVTWFNYVVPRRYSFSADVRQKVFDEITLIKTLHGDMKV
jgi:hypothetical protein